MKEAQQADRAPGSSVAPSPAANISEPHIVHMTTVHPALDVRIFLKECCSLAGAGYRVTLLAPHVRDEVVGGVRVIGLPAEGRRLRRMLISPARALRKGLWLGGDLYHFHDPELLLVGVMLRTLGKRVVYDIHEDTPQDLQSRDYLPRWARKPIGSAVRWLEDQASRYLSALIVATPAIGSRFQRANPLTTVISNYPLQEEFLPPSGTPWSGRRASVAYVGAIARERGVFEMVEAMACLPEELGARLELVGSFSPAEQREHAMRLCGWARTNEWGALSRPEVAKVLSTVRAGLVVFHPEPNHVCAQPNKLFEYMSAGLPVIASDFPLWRQMIEAAGCGLLVDPLDPRGIARAIEYVLAHPAEAEAMGQRGQEAVRRCYNWGLEEAKLLRLYAGLLASQTQQPGRAGNRTHRP